MVENRYGSGQLRVDSSRSFPIWMKSFRHPPAVLQLLFSSSSNCSVCAGVATTKNKSSSNNVSYAIWTCSSLPRSVNSIKNSCSERVNEDRRCCTAPRKLLRLRSEWSSMSSCVLGSIVVVAVVLLRTTLFASVEDALVTGDAALQGMPAGLGGRRDCE